MKFAFIEPTTGAVRQFQDHDLFGYAEAPAAELVPLPDDFEFPEDDGPRWVVGGQVTTTAPAAAPLPHAALVASALDRLRTERTPILSVLDGLQVSAVVVGDTTTAQAIEACKQGLRDAATAVDLSACTTYEQMRQAFKAYYAGLVAKAPASVRLAFATVAG